LEESDVHSLTMIAFEVRPSYVIICVTGVLSPDQVLSGVPPYDKKSETLVAFSIKNQTWPPRPRGGTADIWLPDTVWDAIKGCWSGDPRSRSSLDSLHRTFVGSKPVQKDSVTAAVNGKHDVTFNTCGLVLKTTYRCKWAEIYWTTTDRHRPLIRKSAGAVQPHCTPAGRDQ